MTRPKFKATFIEYHPFFQCCKNSVEKLKEHEKEFNSLMRTTHNKEMSETESNRSFYLQHQVEIHELSAPIYAITAAENFINLYSDSLIEGDHFYTTENLESLGLFSKWIVIPFFACGTELDIKSSAMKEFQELIKVRNNLIHAKPVRSYGINSDKFERASMKFDNRSKDRRRIAKRADKIVMNLLSELMGIDERKDLTDLIGNLKIPIPKK